MKNKIKIMLVFAIVLQCFASVKFPLNFKPGFNGISVPYNSIDVPDDYIAYSFDPTSRSYRLATTMESGSGYWILSFYEDVLWVEGTPVESHTYELEPGWNLIGSLGRPVDESYFTTRAIQCLNINKYNSEMYSTMESSDWFYPGYAQWVLTDTETDFAVTPATVSNDREVTESQNHIRSNADLTEGSWEKFSQNHHVESTNGTNALTLRNDGTAFAQFNYDIYVHTSGREGVDRNITNLIKYHPFENSLDTPDFDLDLPEHEGFLWDYTEVTSGCILPSRYPYTMGLYHKPVPVYNKFRDIILINNGAVIKEIDANTMTCMFTRGTGNFTINPSLVGQDYYIIAHSYEDFGTIAIKQFKFNEEGNRGGIQLSGQLLSSITVTPAPFLDLDYPYRAYLLIREDMISPVQLVSLKLNPESYDVALSGFYTVDSGTMLDCRTIRFDASNNVSVKHVPDYSNFIYFVGHNIDSSVIYSLEETSLGLSRRYTYSVKGKTEDPSIILSMPIKDNSDNVYFYYNYHGETDLDDAHCAAPIIVPKFRIISFSENGLGGLLTGERYQFDADEPLGPEINWTHSEDSYIDVVRGTSLYKYLRATITLNTSNSSNTHMGVTLPVYHPRGSSHYDGSCGGCSVDPLFADVNFGSTHLVVQPIIAGSRPYSTVVERKLINQSNLEGGSGWQGSPTMSASVFYDGSSVYYPLPLATINQTSKAYNPVSEDECWPTNRHDNNQTAQIFPWEVDAGGVFMYAIAGKVLELNGYCEGFDSATVSYSWSGPNQYSSSSLTPTVSNNASESLNGFYVLTVSDTVYSFKDSIEIKVVDPDFQWKRLFDLPNPYQTEQESLFFDYSLSGDTLLLTERSTGDTINGALIAIQCGDSVIIDNVDSTGHFVSPLIGKTDSTTIFIHKPRYRTYIQHYHGTIEDTDTLYKGDVHLHGDLIVPTGDTLTIKAGTHVMFEPSSDQNSSGVDTTLCEIIVRGHLRVEGTSDDSVYFEAALGGSGSNQWYGITIDNGGSVDIEYAKFTDCKDAIYGHTGTDKIIASNLTIEDANIMADFTQGSTNKTIQLDYIDANGDVAICGSDANSWIRNSNFDLETATFYVVASLDTLEITSCEFNPIGKTGVAVNLYGEVLIDDCIFKNGSSKTSAIALNNSTAKMYNSTIDSCDVGVYIENGSDFWAGDTFSAAGEAGNIIQNCSSYLIRNVNSKSPSVYCQNVFWGDSTGPNLNYIDESGAEVYYYPWTGYSKYNCKLATVHCVPCEYDSIQDAIDAVNSATDVVYIHPGTYTPNSVLVVNEPMIIAGESETSTIVSGQGIQQLFKTTALSTGDDVYVSDLKVYDGFESSGSGYATSGGAGWRIINSDGAVHFDNIVFESCTTASYGGAIWAFDAPFTVNDCVFANNGSALGCGAVEGRDSTNKPTHPVTVTNSTFYNNIGKYGGALRLLFKNGNLIENNVVYNNYSVRTGNVTLQYTTNNIYHNTLYDNETGLYDGALTLTGGYCDSKILGNLFNSNTGPYGNDIGTYVNSTYDLLYNLIDTTGIYNWNYIDANISNFTGVPGFVDTINYDLRLGDSSTCIDATPDTLGTLANDRDGVARDSNPDIGAYEYPVGGYARANTEWNDPTPETIPSAVELGSPVPNPFNSTVSIDFLVREESDLEITIHDINGKLIRTMIDENVQSGHWATTWDGRDNAMNLMTSGVYFIKLNVNGRTVESKSVTLIK